MNDKIYTLQLPWIKQFSAPDQLNNPDPDTGMYFTRLFYPLTDI